MVLEISLFESFIYLHFHFIYHTCHSKCANLSIFYLVFVNFYRDTPHHLKNKRVQHGAIDKAAANILLSNALKQPETHHKIIAHTIPEISEFREDTIDEGKQDIDDYFVYVNYMTIENHPINEHKAKSIFRVFFEIKNNT